MSGLDTLAMNDEQLPHVEELAMTYAHWSKEEIPNDESRTQVLQDMFNRFLAETQRIATQLGMLLPAEINLGDIEHRERLRAIYMHPRTRVHDDLDD